MDIVREKEFIELTAADRAELGELCSSEDEYNQIKSMFVGMSAMDWSNPTPKAETKASLDALFAQTYPKAAPVWYNAPLAVLIPKEKPLYRQPLVQVAAVGLLVLLAYPFVNSTKLEANADQVATLEKEMTTPEKKEESVETTTESMQETKEASSKEQAATVRNDLKSRAADSPLSENPSTTSVESTLTAKDATPMNLSTTAAEVTFNATFSADEAVAWTQPGSTHPDGVFVGDLPELLSVPASENPAVFDLLTSTF